MSGVFISYRRDDAAGHAGRLFDHLSRVFGSDEIFMDVDGIQRGDTFSQTLTEHIQQCDVLLAVIGRRWTAAADSDGHRRLDSADDWVRGEIRGALTAGHLVIPVLVGGAGLPAGADLPEDLRGLVERQVAEVRDGSWNDDVARLCDDIKQRRRRGTWVERLREHRVSASIVLALALLAGAYSTFTYLRSSQTTVPLVSGLTLDRAARALTDAGLQAGAISRRATNEYPRDWVIEQQPTAHAGIRKGASVSLIVATPRAVDLSSYITVRDVGTEGTVAAAALAAAMDGALAAQGQRMPFSMRYIYEKAKRHDEVTGEGTFLETTIYVARQFGAPPEALWPYVPFDRRLPAGVTWSRLDDAAKDYKAQIAQVATVDGVLGALDRKLPVIAAATATESWSSEATTRTGVIEPKASGERELGGTVITIVAFDPATRRFKFANNWGVGWGDQGFGYFNAANAAAILRVDTGLWSVSVPLATR